MTGVAVCVITYRRPEGLTRLLDSLSSNRAEDADIHVIVVDNDPSGSARSSVCASRFAERDITYAIEPEPGIPAARNRSIEIARAMDVDYVAFIDDDEIASPSWIASLLRRVEQSGVDAVNGPVEPVFPPNTPTWAVDSGLFDRPRFDPGQTLDYASTANALLRLASIDDAERPFDSRFQFTGGSDTFLFQTLRLNGGSIVWEPDATVYEYVPRQRIAMRWLIARGYRHGITVARCDVLLRPGISRVLQRAAVGIAHVAVGAMQAITGVLLRRHSWRNGAVRVSRGIGTIAGLFGVTYEEYRRPSSDLNQFPG